jgi:hypothetical protein
MQNGGGAGGATIMDLPSGALSYGNQFINLHALLAKNHQALPAEPSEILKSVMSRVRHEVSRFFGVNKIMGTTPRFISRMDQKPAQTMHDEYWSPCLFYGDVGLFYGGYRALLWVIWGSARGPAFSAFLPSLPALSSSPALGSLYNRHLSICLPIHTHTYTSTRHPTPDKPVADPGARALPRPSTWGLGLRVLRLAQP